MCRREDAKHFTLAITLQRILLTVPNMAIEEKTRREIARDFHREVTAFLGAYDGQR